MESCLFSPFLNYFLSFHFLYYFLSAKFTLGLAMGFVGHYAGLEKRWPPGSVPDAGLGSLKDHLQLQPLLLSPEWILRQQGIDEGEG